MHSRGLLALNLPPKERPAQPAGTKRRRQEEAYEEEEEEDEEEDDDDEEEEEEEEEEDADSEDYDEASEQLRRRPPKRQAVARRDAGRWGGRSPLRSDRAACQATGKFDRGADQGTGKIGTSHSTGRAAGLLRPLAWRPARPLWYPALRMLRIQTLRV